MPCCNNECLENINAACVDYTGTEFQCISTDAENLQEILIDIDSKLCDAGIDISTSDITIDTKCITGDCPGTLPATVIFTAGTTTDVITIVLPGLNSTPIIYDSFVSTVSIYAGNSLITEGDVSTSPSFTIPNNWNNNGVLSIHINVIVGVGISPYSALITIPQNSNTATITSTLNCTANTVITTTVKTLLEMIIGKICDLQNQINVLGG